ncbi:hypothetical protein EYW49_04240 [Siculibacillus lacustris]|uniref:Helicase/UvrB N-terminal domain-containing protein n=1 Tax=Siculibacillus lacustris TaxID=1549641 RepID=A0A4Q9VX46_9HYPH|nr:hypothetical protein EYW49_04240 [Siculibacillus lacustris]
MVETTRVGLSDLKDSGIDWLTFADIDKVALLDKKKPRPHQIEALAAVKAGLATADRGKMVMACGRGKTYTGLIVSEALAGKGGRMLYLVPSLSLMSQTIRERSIVRGVGADGVARRDRPIPRRGFARAMAMTETRTRDTGERTVTRRDDEELTRSHARRIEFGEVTADRRCPSPAAAIGPDVQGCRRSAGAPRRSADRCLARIHRGVFDRPLLHPHRTQWHRLLRGQPTIRCRQLIRQPIAALALRQIVDPRLDLRFVGHPLDRRAHPDDVLGQTIEDDALFPVAQHIDARVASDQRIELATGGDRPAQQHPFDALAHLEDRLVAVSLVERLDEQRGAAVLSKQLGSLEQSFIDIVGRTIDHETQIAHRHAPFVGAVLQCLDRHVDPLEDHHTKPFRRPVFADEGGEAIEPCALVGIVDGEGDRVL